MKMKRVSTNDRYDQWVTYTVPQSARLSEIHDALQNDESADFEKYAIIFGGSRGEYEDPPKEFFVYNVTDIYSEVVDAIGGVKHFLQSYIPRPVLLQALREIGIEVKEEGK